MKKNHVDEAGAEWPTASDQGLSRPTQTPTLNARELMHNLGITLDQAAFIVRAVKCHEEILNALRDAVIDLDSIYNHAAVYGDFVVSLGKFRRLNSIKHAITKAEGL
jgi:hypothetical protein